MIAKIHQSIYFMVIILFVGHSFQRVGADYAPEKMDLDDEARQEMRLEPRSFIPHPRPNRAEISTNDQAKVFAPHKDEPEEKHDGSGEHKDEEEVVKDDEGSSTGSGQESISLGSHEEGNSQKQKNVLPADSSLSDKHIKSFTSPVVIHSPESRAMSTMNDNQTTPLVTAPQVINLSGNTSAQNITDSADGNEKSVSEENKKAENESPEVEDEKDDNENSGTAAQKEGSAVDDSQYEEPEKDGGSNKEDVGDALKLGLSSAKSLKKDENDAEKDRDNDEEDENGSGMDGEKTKSSKPDGEEKDEKAEDKNAENEDRENADHSYESDKKMKDDNDDDDDNNDDNDDKEDGDHDDTNSGTGELPAKQADNTPHAASTTTTASEDSLDKDTANHIDKTTAKAEEEGEDDDDHNEKEDKMEDAINNENEEPDEDEDEDEENESRIEIKEQKELEPGMTTEPRQKFQQSTVHKLQNKNASHTQNSSEESSPKPTQEQIHQLSTIHKVKNVQKLDNERQKTRKIYVQHASMHSAVHTEKNVASSEALMKKHAKKPNKQVKIAKPTHHKHNVNLKHHEVQHNDKIHKKPRKSKTLLKYIHRPNLHKKRVGTKHHKTPQHKCNSDNVKHGYSLKGGTRAGHVEDLGGSAGMHECIKRCCHKKVCDVALMLDGRCFGIACYSKELCKPVMVPHPHYVNSQIAFLDRAQRRDEVEGARPEFDCKYGELAIRNNHRWSGELCGGVVTCRNGVVAIEKCPGVPPKPTDCANPILEVQHRPGQCCIKKWTCKDKSCEFGGRRIPHGVSLSDQLCTGVVKCLNGHLEMKECPALPKKPNNCAHPKLKITTIPGQCCKKRWVCPDKSCSYGELKIEDGERLTDASCAVVMECKNGFLDFKQCPDPSPIPSACLNPTLKVKRILGECCHRKWACAQETK